MTPENDDLGRAWRLDPWGRTSGDVDNLRRRISPHLGTEQVDALLSILAGAERSMGLNPSTELLEIDATAGPSPVLVLRTSHGGIFEPDVHLAEVGREDDVSSLATQIGWSIREMTDEIARRRTWAQAGTTHPPLETMETTPVTHAFMEHHGCDAGLILSATWANPGNRRHQWRSANRKPAFKVNRAPSHVAMLDIPEGLPWCAGRNGIYDLQVTWIDLGGGNSYDACNGRYRRRGTGGGNAVDVRAKIPEAVAMSLRHRPLREVVAHPVLDQFPFWIRSVETLTATTRLHLGGVDDQLRVPLSNGPRPHAIWASHAAEVMRRGMNTLCGASPSER